MPASSVIVLVFLLLNMISFPVLNAANIKNWPVEIESDAGKITIFQPEVESLSNDMMECNSAVIVQLKNNSTPYYGAIWYESRISTDRDKRTVTLLDITIVADKFHGIDEETVGDIKAYIEQEVPQWVMVMSLDEILTALEYTEEQAVGSEQLNNEAPEIIFATIPSALISVDGIPELKEIEGTGFEYVVNTPFFIVKDTRTGLYYLKGGKRWYSSGNFYKGWSLSESTPQQVISFENESSGQEEELDDNFNGTMPSQIIIRTEPAELLMSNGSPKYAPVKNTSLLYMTNTDDDILMDIGSQEYYVLISGRWYKSKKLDSNDWTFIPPDQLPDDFYNIPEDSPVGNVLASIAGTQDAKEAVLETRIPQTAEIDRNSATLDVTYDGDPVWDDVEGTDIRYAVNTDKAVMYVDNAYYCCDNAVWFRSSRSRGPWTVAVSIPARIREIPPSCPLYHVRYVFIFDYTDDIVRIGYMQGYVQNYIYRGCVFYGTGYHYRPWYRNWYYARPVTYGFNAHYNPYSGWGFSYGVSFGGFRWINQGKYRHSYNEGMWGPDGYRNGLYRGAMLGDKRGFSQHKPTPPKGSQHSQPSLHDRRAYNNVYLNRSNGVSRTGNERFDPKTGKQISGSSSSGRRAGTSVRSNNLYSDESGNVYKNRNNGEWKSKTNKPRTESTSRRQLDQTVKQSSATTSGRQTTSPVQNRTSTSTTQRQPAKQTTAPNRQTNSISPKQQSGTSRQSRPSGSSVQNKPSTSTGRNQQSTTVNQQSTTVNQSQKPAGRNKASENQSRQNLDNQYNSRVRSSERTNTYNSNKTQYQYTQPAKSSSSSTETKQSRPAVKDAPAQRSSQPASKKPAPAKNTSTRQGRR